MSIEIIDELGHELHAFYDQFKGLFSTRTRDVSHHGFTGLTGSLLMEGKRTYPEVSPKIVDPLDDGQNYQHLQKQYLGRLGKVDVGQVGVVSSWYREGIGALTDAELFLPESWFTPEKRREWERLHIPKDREFRRKLDLAREQIDHAVANQ